MTAPVTTTTTPTTAGAGESEVFDLYGELPTATTVLEASAGTGKTFTVAALTTRYVAEGVADLSQLMLVTFGRAATSELRDRVRERLVTAERALRRPDARDSDDTLVAHLAAVDDAELSLRRERLTRALAQFDAATIATTHGFCQQMLTTLSLLSDVDADAVLVPDISDLVDEAVDDLYLQRYADATTPPILGVADARRVAAAAVADPQAGLEPTRAPADTLPGHRYAFARDVVAEVAARKRARRILDYDDLLTLLRDALVDPEHGQAAAERIRSRYRIVLVDEFQDTDPVQWEILRTAFHGHRTLVLIGDPKQAIYGFRGGDVVTYLSARQVAAGTATLGRNWRSDAPLLHGLDQVFGGAALGNEAIVVHPVHAAHRERRMDAAAPVRIRQVTRPAFGPNGASRLPPIDEVRRLIAADVAADVVVQLEQTRLQDGPTGWRPLRPGDIAVLTGRNADAHTVRAALVEAGVPAVVSGLASVFETSTARDWLMLLSALEQPGHSGRAATLALTPFVGWDATRLAGASDAERDGLSDRIRAWAQVLTVRGVGALLEAAAADGLTERLLRTSSGERVLTDLRHIGHALHAAALQDRLGAAALTDWLRRRVDEAKDDHTEDRSRRLETDAAAVQVVTIHASKGLEFPLVYVPYAWNRYEPPDPPPVLRFHDDRGNRLLHVGGDQDAHHAAALQRHQTEERGEDLRLLYVALTRARSQVVTWWAPSRNSPAGPLTRMLFGGHTPGQQPPARVTLPSDDVAAQTLTALAAASDATIAVESVDHYPAPALWSPPATDRPDLTVAAFTRRLDLTWRRTSYSGLTAAVHAEQPAGAAGSEPETTGVDDEPDPTPTWPGDDAPGAAQQAAAQVVSPLAGMPAGTGFGTLVHEVLEHLDTSAADLDAELLRACRHATSAHLPGVNPAELAAALRVVISTPLGPLADGLTLGAIPASDRLAEMEFEVPLAGGDTPSGPGSTLGDIADLLRRHLPPGDAFAAYPDRLLAAGLGDARLRGYLTGSLDAVLRVRHDSQPSYLVVDYKTNRLAPEGEQLTAWHYRPPAMTEAMMQAHYPLQLLLYLTALHRFLRWRQPGYDPDIHLAGGLYLFVRGMCGPDTPVLGDAPCGVAAWRPPSGLVADLSALLAGRPL